MLVPCRSSRRFLPHLRLNWAAGTQTLLVPCAISGCCCKSRATSRAPLATSGRLSLPVGRCSAIATRILWCVCHRPATREPLRKPPCRPTSLHFSLGRRLPTPIAIVKPLSTDPTGIDALLRCVHCASLSSLTVTCVRGGCAWPAQVSINNLGGLLQERGQLEAAEALYMEALAARRQTLGDTHPDTLISINNLGGARRFHYVPQRADTPRGNQLQVAPSPLSPANGGSELCCAFAPGQDYCTLVAIWLQLPSSTTRRSSPVARLSAATTLAPSLQSTSKPSQRLTVPRIPAHCALHVHHVPRLATPRTFDPSTCARARMPFVDTSVSMSPSDWELGTPFVVQARSRFLCGGGLRCMGG